METMTAREGLVGLLAQAHQALAAVAGELGSMASLSADELMEAAELAAGIARLSDAAMVTTVDAVQEQCRRAGPEESLACRYGFRDAAALLVTITGASRRTLTRWRQIAGETTPRGIGSSGILPPWYPQLAEQLAVGAVSLDQALVIRQHLNEARARAHPEALEAAEQALVAAAMGAVVCEHEHDDAGDEQDCAQQATAMPLPPDLLAVQARAWRDAIDPDGPEPTYEQQRQARSFTLGKRLDGMWIGKLLLPPDQGEALRLALDAHNAPRTTSRHDAAGADEGDRDTASGGDGDSGSSDSDSADLGVTALNRRGMVDDRTTAQRQADTLVGLITDAIKQGDAPRIGGDAPTLVVTITNEELTKHATTGAGTAHLEHSGEPVPAHVAARIMCDGYLQACVLGKDGLPLQLGRARRSHTRHQRRAILAAYTGGCQNPRCHAAPGFTEIHHPIWWSRGGHTDALNGVPLCQHCHAELHAGRLRCELGEDGRWHILPAIPLRSRTALAWSALA
ncbi:HNH endonuclease signature motif containing protein [Pseudactinotalea terrae]|uniref:HNH endonuclease signature motif containing protein n=1 Tax=Pseudactinotalea terrae TaxID=1743262 RepID=UPI0012E30BA8|nr:HNH endonuclease signature motif containing protein [Pseudactinotalea terrae]